MSYDEDGWTIHYVREDVDDMYSQADREQIHRELLMTDLSRPIVQGMFHGGALEFRVTGFEDALVCHIPRGEYTGWLILTDRGAVDSLDRLEAICVG